MSPKQKKIAAKAPPPNVFNEKDLAVLREEKAKGRGMGLQDEKVQPGKVMKAKMGVATDYKKYLKGLKKATDSVKKDKFIKRRMKLMGMPKLSKGGGFDAGTPGKVRDVMSQIKVKGKNFNANKLTKRDLQALKESKKGKLRKIITSDKYMGGGMMQKPMGYKTGGGYDSGTPGKLRDLSSKFNKDGVTFKNFKNSRVKGTDQSPRLKKLIKKREALGTAKSVLKTLSSVASPGTAAGSAAYKLAKKMKDKDRFTKRDVETAKSLVGMGSKNRPIKKDHSSRNPNPKTPEMMGGGMMQKPMGYTKGTMVKARGCKLGRTKPTKIT